jgi:sporulation protein YqfD
VIRTLLRYFKGYVKIRVKGYSPERFLNMCRHHQIYIWGLTPSGDAYEMYISLQDFRHLKPVLKKTHTKVNVSGRYGFPFFMHRYRRRKVFFIGFFVCVVLLYAYSGFIWDIHFEGNERWTDETLIEFLAARNVYPFMRKSETDCAQIAKEIRREYKDIVWVSASIDGTRLHIQIKENEDHLPEAEMKTEQKTPKDLIATEDGVITKIVTRSGVPQVHIGDTVSKGDILVSGRVDVLNDNGEVTDYQYQVADADIYADTTLEYTDSLPLIYLEKKYDKKHRSQYYLQFGSWRLSVGTIQNAYENAEISTEEHQIKVGENFYLPVIFGRKEAKSYAYQQKNYTEKELQAELSENFRLFCMELEEKGIQIKENSVKIHIDKNTAAASGTVYLNQRITEEADTEILTIERVEQDESGRVDNGDTG